MAINTNPLIKDDPSDTIDAVRIRTEYIGQWAEGDDSLRALLQDMHMMREALISAAEQISNQKI